MNFGINKETYHQLFDDIYGDYYNPNLKVINYLDYYTKLSDTAINLLPNTRKEQYNINHFSYDSDTKTYDYKDSSIYFRFWKISDLFNDKNIVKELTTDKRYGNCHELSFKMSRYFKDSKILTGYRIMDNCLVLHSVIELSNGKIFDWTMNAILEKSAYIKLTYFIPISEVTSTDIINDSKTIYKNINLPIEVYLLFRNELASDYAKKLKR